MDSPRHSVREMNHDRPTSATPELELASTSLPSVIGNTVEDTETDSEALPTAPSPNTPLDPAIENAPFDYVTTFCAWEKLPEEIARLNEEELPEHLFTEPLLTADEEQSLAHTMKQGGPDAEAARERYILANLRLVRSVLRDLRPFESSALSVEDLFQEGVSGLAHAVDHFNPEEYPNTRFATFAVWHIAALIRRAANTTGDTIRKPTRQRLVAWAALEVGEELQRDLGRLPTYAEVAQGIRDSRKSLQVTASHIHDLFKARILSDEPAAHASELEYLPHLSPMAPPETPSPEKSEHIAFLAARIKELSIDQTDREREILRLRYPSDPDEEPKTLDDVGKVYGLSREGIRQIESKALKKLRSRALRMKLNVEGMLHD